MFFPANGPSESHLRSSESCRSSGAQPVSSLFQKFLYTRGHGRTQSCHMFQVGTRWHPGRHPPILVAGSMRKVNGPIGTRWHPERHPLILADGLCKMTISGRTPGLIYITKLKTGSRPLGKIRAGPSLVSRILERAFFPYSFLMRTTEETFPCLNQTGESGSVVVQDLWLLRSAIVY